jgi:pimeloyl-ACP methyl ester carboxylesterase
VSLGGMVAQTLAIVHPSRVRSLCSMMSTPGGRWQAIGRPRALATLFRRPPRSAAEAGQAHIDFLRACGSPGFPLDEAAARARGELSYRRSFYPPGFARHMAAVLATGDRTGALRFVRAPTLVIHGAADPLIPPAGGRATARAIPGAELLLVEGLGHDLPEGVWPTLIDALGRHALDRRPRAPDRGEIQA